MKKPRAVALVAAGAVKHSLILRTPGIVDRIGPVKGLSYRVASRTVNTIRAGHPVEDYAQLGECPAVLISVPDPLLPSIVNELAASPIVWAGKIALLCDTNLDSLKLAPLRSAGASVASVSIVDVLDPPRHVLEGDRLAVLAARRLFATGPARTIELRPGAKTLYLAGLAFATSLVTPLAVASVECLRKAGAGPTAAPDLVEKLLLRAVRLWRKAGKKGWTGPLPEGSRVEDLGSAVSKFAPEFSRYLEDSVRGARVVLGKRASGARFQ